MTNDFIRRLENLTPEIWSKIVQIDELKVQAPVLKEGDVGACHRVSVAVGK